MTKLQKILKNRQNPTVYKDLFKKHKIPLHVVSEHTGRSYSYVSRILNNRLPISKDMERRLDALVAEIKQMKE